MTQGGGSFLNAGDISGRAMLAGRRQETNRCIQVLMRVSELQTATKQCQQSEREAEGLMCWR